MASNSNKNVGDLPTVRQMIKLYDMNNDSYDPTKMNVILDLDNTIINSLSFTGEIQKVPASYQSKFAYSDMDKYYRIFERPHLQVFLDYLFANFNVSVFTAADKPYALHILKHIILTDTRRDKKSSQVRRIHYFFFGYHSGLSEYIYHTPKDLRLLWNMLHDSVFTPDNTIMIDDLPDVSLANPYQTLKAEPFEILINQKLNNDADKDVYLLKIIPVLEQKRLDFRNRLLY